VIEIRQGAEVALFVGSKCGTVFAEPYTAIGYSVDGRMVGGAVFNGYSGRNVDLSIGHDAKSWPVAFVRFFGDYVWNTLKVERMTMIVRPSLVPLCRRMGGTVEGKLRNWYSNGDAVILGVLKSEWKL
jgi:hypothetical protein